MPYTLDEIRYQSMECKNCGLLRSTIDTTNKTCLKAYFGTHDFSEALAQTDKPEWWELGYMSRIAKSDYAPCADHEDIRRIVAEAERRMIEKIEGIVKGSNPLEYSEWADAWRSATGFILSKLSELKKS